MRRPIATVVALAAIEPHRFCGDCQAVHRKQEVCPVRVIAARRRHRRRASRPPREPCAVCGAAPPDGMPYWDLAGVGGATLCTAHWTEQMYAGKLGAVFD